MEKNEYRKLAIGLIHAAEQFYQKWDEIGHDSSRVTEAYSAASQEFGRHVDMRKPFYLRYFVNLMKYTHQHEEGDVRNAVNSVSRYFEEGELQQEVEQFVSKNSSLSRGKKAI